MVVSTKIAPPRRDTKSSRLVARISRVDKDVITRAAALKGESVANFVLSRAREAAVRLLQEQNEIRLNQEETRRLLDALLAPPEPTDALRQAMKRHRETVVSDTNPSLAVQGNRHR